MATTMARQRPDLVRPELTSLLLNSPHHGDRRDSRDHSRPREPSHGLTLPSIYELVPDIPHASQAAQAASVNASPPNPAGAGMATPPEYVYSPSGNKRSRPSPSEEADPRSSQIPRVGQASTLYPVHPSPKQPHRGVSPAATPRLAMSSWPSPPGTSPFSALPAGSSSISPPAPVSSHATKHQTTLPSFSQAPCPVSYRDTVYDFSGERQWASAHHTNSQQSRAAANTSHYAIGYSLTPQPYTAASYSPSPYTCAAEQKSVHGFNSIGAQGENKPRKRRGNLPKEATDMLRGWFRAHVNHPYPTEEEKQELVRQTGLQMNQISNWFINARRRQLPAMARAASADGCADGLEGPDSGTNSPRSSMPSDGENSAFD